MDVIIEKDIWFIGPLEGVSGCITMKVRLTCGVSLGFW